jgi:hypothetical protein
LPLAISNVASGFACCFRRAKIHTTDAVALEATVTNPVANGSAVFGGQKMASDADPWLLPRHRNVASMQRSTFFGGE